MPITGGGRGGVAVGVPRDVSDLLIRTVILGALEPGCQMGLGDLVQVVTGKLERMGFSVVRMVGISLSIDEALSGLEAEGAVSVSRGVVGTFIWRSGV